MIKIVPAILESDFAKIEERFKTVSGLVPMVQVDICDGKFVPSKTIGSAGCSESFERLRDLAEKYNMKIELDMMVDLDIDIVGRFDKWMSALKVSGATQVVLHFGSTYNWTGVFDALAGSDMIIGLAVHIDSDLQEVANLLDKYNFKYIQVMGIEKVGHGGQSFDNRALDIIKTLRAKYPALLVSVDGGVNMSTAASLIAAGAAQLAAGSAIYKASNPQESIEELALQ